MLYEYETAQVLVLNGILVNNDNFFYDTLKEDYFSGKYKEIYKIIADIIQSKNSCSFVDIYPRAALYGIEDIIGVNCIPATHDDFARAIKSLKSHYNKLRLKAILKKYISELDSSFDFDVNDLVKKLMTFNDDEKLLKDHEEVLEGVINTLEEIINRKAYKGIFTGLSNFDLMVGGFKNGSIYGIAGRTHMGKTEFGIEMALRCIEVGKKVLYCNFEQSAEKLCSIMACKKAGITYSDLRDKVEGYQKVFDIDWLKEQPIYFLNKTCTDFQIISLIKKLKIHKGVDIVFIDYLGLISLSNYPNTLTKHDKMAEVSKTLKNAAMELDIPIVALLQINREVEKSGDKRPLMSHIRDSGQIEQDLDCIMLLYRPAYYDSAAPNYLEVNIAKNRITHKTGKIYFAMENGRFKSITTKPK